MEKGNMEDPILKTLFIGGSRPKEGKTEKELLFRRMRNCWLERSRNYGIKELLKMKMKECQIDTDIDGKWAKYSLMKAPLIIVLKIWINRQGEEKKFLKDFQVDVRRKDRYLSECAMNIQKNGYPNTLSKYIDANIVAHRWDQFPHRDPYTYKSESKRTFHLIKDDLAIYHNVVLHKNQLAQLEAFYKDKDNKKIQLIQQYWSSCICNARGKKKLIIANERKSSRSISVESSEVRQIFRVLEQKKDQEQHQVQEIMKERLSNQESQRSRIDSSVISQVWNGGQHKDELLKDIKVIEEVINLAKQLYEDQDDLILPMEIFPEGLVKFAQRAGVNSHLKLFLKLNFEHLQSGLRLMKDFGLSRMGEFNKAKQLIMMELEFIRADSDEQINNIAKECEGMINVGYYDSNVVVYVPYKNQRNARMIQLRILGGNELERYFRMAKEPHQEMKMIMKHLNKMIQIHGLLRLPYEDRMICPLCARILDKKEIFDHSCAAGIDLAIRRGRQQ